MSGQSVNKVKTLRTKRKLTLVDLCLRTGLGMSTVALADRGLLSERTATLLAPVLDVAPDDLLPKPRRPGA